MPTNENAGPARSPRIILLDSNEETARCLRKIFDQKGYEVRSAKSGLELDQLRASGFAPDLMLLDWPALSGASQPAELVRDFGARNDEMRVVFMSPWLEEPLRDFVRSTPGTVALKKPLGLMEVSVEVEAMLERRRS